MDLFLYVKPKMKIDIYSSDGSKKGSADLNQSLFAAPVNEDLMHRAVVMRLANRRTPIAHTKTRGDVAYSTKKMFRQKGTGNARRGARSTNLLRGGGVAHGPTNLANYAKMMPKRERRAALFSSLSSQQGNANVFGLEGFDATVPSTKDFSVLLDKLPAAKKLLFVVASKDELFEKSCRNIPGVKIIQASYLNPMDVLWADKICFVGDALNKTESTFLN